MHTPEAPCLGKGGVEGRLMGADSGREVRREGGVRRGGCKERGGERGG